MSTMEIYLVSGGDTAKMALQAIATYFNSNDNVNLVKIVGMIGLMMTAARFFMTRDHNNILGWLATYLLIPTLLLTPKVGVHIFDNSKPLGNYYVANVPIGVALPASYGTTFMHGMAEIVDDIFRLPNDYGYSKSGMLFGSTIWKLSTSVGIQDPELKSEWSHYISNCIRPDIIVNKKYTWEQLANSGDILTFLASNKPSPLRRIAMENDLITCKDALPKLAKKFEDETQGALALISTQGVNGVVKEATALQNAIGNSAATFHNIHTGGAEVLKQNMAVNAVRAGLMDGAASNNATAAAMNYSKSLAETRSTSSMYSVGLTAADWLPLIHSTLIILIMCTSIFVFLAAFIPGMTFPVLKGYVTSFFYLSTWPVLFAFINMIMTYSLQHAGADMSQATPQITLANENAVQAMHVKFTAIAGWLMAMVPFLAGAVLKGGNALAGSMANRFMAGVNAQASSAANASTGDVNFANMQAHTSQMNNSMSNKLDETWSASQYGATLQRPDGSTTTYFPNGNTYNNQGAISKTHFDMNNSEAQSRSLQRNLGETQREVESERRALSRSVNNTADTLVSASETAGKNTSYGSGTQDSVNASVSNTFSQMDSLIEEQARQTGQSKTDTYKSMLDGYIGGDFHVSGTLSTGEKNIGVAKAKADATLKVGGGIKQTWTDGSSTDDTRSETERNADSKQLQFNKLMGDLEQYSANTNTSELNSANQQALSSVSNSLRETKDLTAAVEDSSSREKAYSQALIDSESGTLSLGHNLIPEFQKFVERKEPGSVDMIMTGTTQMAREAREQMFTEFTAQKFADYQSPITGESVTPSNRDLQLSDAGNQHLNQGGEQLNTQHQQAAQGNQALKGSYYDENNYTNQRDDSMLNQGATRVDMRSTAAQEPTRRANEEVADMVKDTYQQKALTGSEEYAPHSMTPKEKIDEITKQVKKGELP
ncbi:hypothetical protein TUM4438_39690 [Shewanella sairae]|uniref:TraG N-terminal Proteobacteria domain-containing protein n=1 Tax=Shewanella sairae TaxID=190310 RepID=A0ABQ4PQ52_9GAMM|nr:conjugal transfer mating-pair stabilization protein TraG [Shewanella sairae]MCL1132089.1 conjugal transfer mating pair stabilization protein TraG [Shewanella sairae]GIU51140.1 hypothetical protein TUM4438_39690 [Shewanella sairae]